MEYKYCERSEKRESARWALRWRKCPFICRWVRFWTPVNFSRWSSVFREEKSVVIFICIAWQRDGGRTKNMVAIICDKSPLTIICRTIKWIIHRLGFVSIYFVNTAHLIATKKSLSTMLNRRIFYSRCTHNHYNYV